MDLVDEKQRALPVNAPLLRFVERLAKIRDTGKDSRERDEMELRLRRHDPGQRGFAAPRRPPEDEAGQPPRVDHAPQRGALAEQMILPDDLVEGVRTHAVGQRPRNVRREKAVVVHAVHDSTCCVFPIRHRARQKAAASGSVSTAPITITAPASCQSVSVSPSSSSANSAEASGIA